MIPCKLHMRNFMCYREQTLDLRGVHLACLTGNNGHGKSAILDAMTWALWGRSRVGARRDDELIRLGQTEMEAEFEFVLLEGMAAGEERASSGTRYRVIRKRTRRRRGQSSLELQGWDAVTDRFRPLNESTMARTQHKINELLRMDYDTFINSAFLLQGRADEFTIKRPAERKRVLGDILGLQIYDRYETLAKQVAQERKERGDNCLAAVEQIDLELAREPEYKAIVETAETKLALLQNKRPATEKAYDQARTILQEAESAQQRLAELEGQIADTQSKTERLTNDIAKHQGHLQDLESALSQETEIKDGYKAYQEAVTGNEAMNNKLARSVPLKEQHASLEKRIASVRHRLDVTRHSVAETVCQLTEKCSALDQEGEWQEIQATLARLDERALQRKQAQAEMQALSTDIAAIHANRRRAEEDTAQIKDKIALLSATGEASEESAQCPLCKQPLSEHNCSHLLTSFRAQLETGHEVYRQHGVKMDGGQRRIDEYKTVIAEIDRELRKRPERQREETTLAHVVGEARQAYEALPAAREALQAISMELERESFAPEEHDTLLQIKQQLSKLEYDADVHRQAQTRLNKLRPFEPRMQILREAQSSVKIVRLAISQLHQSYVEIARDLAASYTQAEGLHEIVEQVPDLQCQATEIRQALESIRHQEQQTSLELGAAHSKVDHCTGLRRTLTEKRQEELQLRGEQAVYQELQRAFGKNGVQAMLIESAIPDIEQEANQLLARMTRGRMHVRFETQRDTKKGNTIETLDIHITDELGTRSYETYSGGERYRINFAIRIALSKLLARRAGAQLQMLVIDEGFGTQDNEGRDGLIDAINAIQDDFACILVITHIEELKDVFDVRIEAQKTGNGSQITVV